MNAQALMTTHLIIALGVAGLGVLGWILHKVGLVLKDLLEALAVIAVVFLALFAVLKACIWVVRTALRCWRTTLTLLAAAAWCRWLGALSLGVAVAVVVVGVGGWWLLAWRSGRLVGFDALVGRRVRAWWMRWWLYARKMPRWLRACRLTAPDHEQGIHVSVNLLRRSGMTRPAKPRRDQTPRIIRVRSGASWDEVRVKLVAGQKPEDFDSVARELAVARGVSRCQVRELEPDFVSIDFQRRDLLTTTVTCPNLDELAQSVGGALALERVWAGRTEYGHDWTVSLRGSHTLTAGATGAGKGSVLWCPNGGSRVDLVHDRVRWLSAGEHSWSLDPCGES
jgi:S-DNA-T family DNA segregation ATPase FtsK/SpoIIIE